MSAAVSFFSPSPTSLLIGLFYWLLVLLFSHLKILAFLRATSHAWNRLFSSANYLNSYQGGKPPTKQKINKTFTQFLMPLHVTHAYLHYLLPDLLYFKSWSET